MRRNNTRRRAGFTVLEVVAAVTILLLLSSAIAAIFDRGSRVWTRASGSALAEREAREALRLIASDIRHAMMGPQFPFVIAPSGSNQFLGAQSDGIWLVSSRDDESLSNRAVQVVWYGVVPGADLLSGGGDGQVLVRRVGSVSDVNDPTDSYNIYWASNVVETFEFSEEGVLAERVGFFLAEAMDEHGRGWLSYDSRELTNQLPSAVSLVLSVFDEESAAQLGQIKAMGGDAEAFADRRGLRYTLRACPRRRWGSGYRGR
jgi:type II secretory pathway pseudopilin PulG